MRLLISVLMVGQLMACIGHQGESERAEKTEYTPLACVEVSIFTLEKRVSSAYVRHSRGTVLFQLSPGVPNDICASQDCELDSVVTLFSPARIKFHSTWYEGFDQSFDMFGDGRIILVPLVEENGGAIGVFVNLRSGKRYFFMPSITSGRLLAKAHGLTKRRNRIKIVTPEDIKSASELAQFPEFER